MLLQPPQALAQTTAKGLLDNFFPRRTIDTRTLGVNAFANDARFGSINAQYREVSNTLRLRYIRILMHWGDAVQSSPTAKINFSFYDDLVKNIPPGVKAVIVLTGLPSWMENSQNWVGGDPRRTFVAKWVAPVAKRYRAKSRVEGFQIWNEPNDAANPDNSVLDVSTKPENYLAMLRLARTSVKRTNRKKLLVSAATTAIAQNFPETLEYNQALKALGQEAVADIWAVHFYGSSYERVLIPGGVGDFMRTLSRPIWITESGKQGVLEQREYAERTWPFLKEEVPKIRRIYMYQFTDELPAENSWGLRTLDPSGLISDLYIYLRDRR